MPRVAAPPRPTGRQASGLSPAKPSMKIPLNDDRREKAVRMQSRHALQELQLSQIKAAASPARKRKSLGPMSSPRTPGSDDKENLGSPGLAVIGGNNSSPAKRVPILANFEEWMKMATDNKINATNSWNFALIDYFHDMSLLKEGDGVNFQKASCTLDGCVKIYTSRVDSVATETGKLLSGLADSGTKKRGEDAGEGGEDEEGEDGEEDEDGVKRKSKKRTQRSSEATLASSFAQLQLKKMELEFSVDPLFKKASADFDEGGAKGLLLNHLTIDADGRIVFDSSEDAQESPESDSEAVDKAAGVNAEAEGKERPEIDIQSLGSKFFPDLARLDEQEICPSFHSFELGGTSNALDIPFLKASEDWKAQNGGSAADATAGQTSGAGLDDEDDDAGEFGGLDMGGDIGFGEGGEAWAKETAVHHQARVHESGSLVSGEDADGVEIGGFDPDSAQYGVTLQHRNDHDNILSYFDQALQKNWAGPEHWRIRKIKDSAKAGEASAPKRKEKEVFEIDFAAPLSKSVTDMLYTRATSNSAVSMPKSQWKSRTRNLLPDDKHFNSRQLLRLFLKPKARIGARRVGASARPAPSQPAYEAGEMDEAFWAREQEQANDRASVDDDAGNAGNYDANFFQDDGLGLPRMGPGDDDDDEFADARETLSPGLGDEQNPTGARMGIDGILDGPLNATTESGFGTQLVTQSRRIRPEYVQYARVAKKVDVRRLKEEMWRGIGILEEKPHAPTPSSPSIEEEPPQSLDSKEQEPLKFTTIMNSLQSAYPAQAMADISTSYCFICLLHLANEKGLVLENGADFEEISIAKDFTAEITAE